MVPRQRHILFAADPLALPLKEVDCDVDCEQSLIFFAKLLHAKVPSTRAASGERRSRETR